MLTQWLAARAGLAYLRIDPLKVDVGKVADTMSAAYAERHKVLPVQVTPSEVVVATADPPDRLDRRGRAPGAPLGAQGDRQPARHRALPGRILRPGEIDQGGAEGGRKRSGGSFEQLVEMGEPTTVDANDQHVMNIVDWLWQYAFDQRASDIHLEPRRDTACPLSHRRHPASGVPVPAGGDDRHDSRIKLLGRMDVIEKRRPQDGRIKTRTVGGQEIELRLSTLPTAFGEKMVMRIFDPEVLVKDLAELGFPTRTRSAGTS